MNCDLKRLSSVISVGLRVGDARRGLIVLYVNMRARSARACPLIDKRGSAGEVARRFGSPHTV